MLNVAEDWLAYIPDFLSRVSGQGQGFKGLGFRV